jgi:hypothetical protein
MKLTKAIVCGGIAFASLASVQAAAYYSGFEAPIYTTGPLLTAPNDLHGQDGWAINGANLPGTGTQTTPSQLSTFVQLTPPGDIWGTLGGQWSTPNTKTVEVGHSAVLPLFGTVFSVDFDIIGSTATFPNRDMFGWSLKDSTAADLVRVAFEPGQPGLLEVVWYDAANTRTSTGFDIAYNAIYNLSLSFATVNGSDLTFYGAIAGSNTVNFNGVLTGAASANIASVNADFDVTSATAAGAGDNYMAFNALAVPEPSSMLTAGLALIGLAGRRRRK